MSTVTPITKNAGRKATLIGLGRLMDDLRNDLRKPEVLNATHEDTHLDLLLEELEGVASEHLVKLLTLAHQREEFEREQCAALAEANAELEHAAYFAHMAGLPEADIYEISKRTADALSNAIVKVKAQA